jgi:hypothetical protein
MGRVRALVVLGCFLFSPMAKAGEREEVKLNKLPRQVTDAVKHSFTNAELLLAWKELESGNECYTIHIIDNDSHRHYYLYSSPDGTFTAFQQDISFLTIWRGLIGAFEFPLLLGVTASVLVQLVVLIRGVSVWWGWFSMWIGAATILCILISSRITVPEPCKGYYSVVIIAFYFVWGAISASVVQVVSLATQSVLRYRPNCRRQILGFCIVILISLSFSILVNIMSIDRDNQCFKKQAMRPLVFEP